MASIGTDSYRALSEALQCQLRPGVTAWAAECKFTESQDTILFSTVNRPHERVLCTVANQADPEAFIITGHGHQASGGTSGQSRHCCEMDDARGLSALPWDNLLAAGRRLSRRASAISSWLMLMRCPGQLTKSRLRSRMVAAADQP